MMRLDKPHSFSLDEALARTKALTDYWSRKYGVKSGWNGASGRISGRVKGLKFDGKIEVDEQRVVAEVDVGILARKLGAPRYVEGKLDDYLDPRHTLESLRSRS